MFLTVGSFHGLNEGREGERRRGGCWGRRDFFIFGFLQILLMPALTDVVEEKEEEQSGAPVAWLFLFTSSPS